MLLTGPGITTQSLATQTLIFDRSSRLVLRNSAALGGPLVHVNFPGGDSVATGWKVGGWARFENASSAGSAVVTNGGAGCVSTYDSPCKGGEVNFFATASAGSASFTNNGGTIDAPGQFQNETTFGYGGRVFFNETSTAANATITNNAGTTALADPGTTEFRDSSTAGNATVINNGGSAGVQKGGVTYFLGSSSAGTATLITNGGTGGGGGGVLYFRQLSQTNASAANARIITNAGGTCDFRSTEGSGLISIVGSIEGAGNFQLGGRNLHVGGAGPTPRTVSGVLSEYSAVSGVSALTVDSPGYLILAGVNTYTGGTTVSAGATLQLGNGGAIVEGPNGSLTNGGNLIVGGVTNNGTLVFNFANSSPNTRGLQEPVITGSGAVVLSPTNDNVQFFTNASASYTGGTTVNSGRLYTAHGTNGVATLGSATAPLTVNGGIIFISNYRDTSGNGNDVPGLLKVGALNGSGGIFAATSTTTNRLSVGNGNADGAYAGSVQDGSPALGLTKVGTGTETFTGAHGYTGTTLVQGGVLSIAAGGSLGNTAVSVSGGAVFNVNGTAGGTVSVTGTLSGTGTITKAVTVNSGGTLSGALTINGLLQVASGGLVQLTSGGTLKANAGVTNNGTIRLERGTQLVVGTGYGFTNNGLVDIITGGFSLAGGSFVNNGVVYDSRVIKAKTISRDTTTLAVTIDGYTGHTYQLQRSDSLASGGFAPVPGVPTQSGTTGSVLTFTDPSPATGQGFYKIAVDP